jgi:hypothetical protein
MLEDIDLIKDRYLFIRGKIMRGKGKSRGNAKKKGKVVKEHLRKRWFRRIEEEATECKHASLSSSEAISAIRLTKALEIG